MCICHVLIRSDGSIRALGKDTRASIRCFQVKAVVGCVVNDCKLIFGMTLLYALGKKRSHVAVMRETSDYKATSSFEANKTRPSFILVQ